MRKRWISGALILTMVVGLLTGCRVGNTELVFYRKRVNNKTIFSINNEKCSTKEAKIYLCSYRSIYGNAYGLNLWDHEAVTEDLEAYVKSISLSELARVFSMGLLAEEQGFALSEEELATIEEAAKVYYDGLSKEERNYIDAKSADISLAFEHYALAMKLYNTLTEGVNEEVSDDEARVIRVQQIYVNDPDVASLVADKLASGEDFAAVAATYNRRSQVEVVVARGDFPLPVELIAYDLDNGQASGLIEAEDGYYFIRCLNKYEAELTEANKSNILLRREKEQFDDHYQAFISGCQVQLNEELWDTITLEALAEEDLEAQTFFDVYRQYFE